MVINKIVKFKFYKKININRYVTLCQHFLWPFNVFLPLQRTDIFASKNLLAESASHSAVFFSHNKSANSTFYHAYQPNKQDDIHTHTNL